MSNSFKDSGRWSIGWLKRDLYLKVRTFNEDGRWSTDRLKWQSWGKQIFWMDEGRKSTDELNSFPKAMICNLGGNWLTFWLKSNPKWSSTREGGRESTLSLNFSGRDKWVMRGDKWSNEGEPRPINFTFWREEGRGEHCLKLSIVNDVREGGRVMEWRKERGKCKERRVGGRGLMRWLKPEISRERREGEVIVSGAVRVIGPVRCCE